MRSFFSVKSGLRFFSFFFIYLAVVLFIGACSCGKMAGGDGDQAGGSANKNSGAGSGGNQTGGDSSQTGDNPGGAPKGWGLVTTNTPWSKRSVFQALVFNDKLWVFGGIGVTQHATDRIWSSSDGTNWNEVVPLGNSWAPRNYFQAAVFGGKMWIIGGETRTAGGINSTFDDIWSSPNGTNWSKIIPTGAWPGQNSRQQVVVFDNKMWMLGKLIDNDIINTSDGINWTRVTPTGAYWAARIFHQAAIFDGKMWVVGGGDVGSIFSDVWSSSNGLNWTEHTVSSAGWKARKSFQMVPFDGKLWILGGGDDITTTSPVFYNDVWTTTNGSDWTEVASSGPWPKRDLFQVVEFKEKLWIIGGSDSNARMLTDIWTFSK